uniref:Putative thymidylate kinase/adenylate kinase n=1 Tax=Triatoma infestans TaxID=30076 RepID=A0A023F118_TRIIF
MASQYVFTSVDQSLNYLKEHTIQSDEVKELVSLYEKAKSHHIPILTKRNHLFIVFEGLDGSGKTTMSSMTSKELKGVQVATPPKSIQHLRAHFDQCEPKLRRAYYSIGNYIAAMEIEVLLNEKHVIMDRFWNSTASYALAESTAEIPAQGDSVYKWPTDLLKPDIIMFLTVREHERLRRTARRIATIEEDKLKSNHEFRERLYKAYSNMEGLTNVESNAPPKPAFKSLMETALKPLLEKL